MAYRNTLLFMILEVLKFSSSGRKFLSFYGEESDLTTLSALGKLNMWGLTLTDLMVDA